TYNNLWKSAQEDLSRILEQETVDESVALEQPLIPVRIHDGGKRKKSTSLSNFCSRSAQAPLKRPVFEAVVSQQRIWTLSSRFQSEIAFQTACACSLPVELSSLGTAVSCFLSPYEITIGKRSFDFRALKAGNSFFFDAHGDPTYQKWFKAERAAGEKGHSKSTLRSACPGPTDKIY
ncbi:hypothetical protein AVEN_28524-2-1, partial [Araneus ventricosus]